MTLSNYCDERFGEEWVVDPGNSLCLHTGDISVPPQVMVWAPKGNNLSITLPFNISLFSYRSPLPPVQVKDGVRVMPVGEALVRVHANFFVARATVATAVLASIGSAAEVAGPLLRGGHAVVAGRLAAAFRTIGRSDVADGIVRAMKSGGHKVEEPDNVFSESAVTPTFSRRTSPVSARIAAIWDSMRAGVLESFVDLPVRTVPDVAAYLSDVDERLTTDAYHSLSIEGYRVTPELIERVRSGQWNPDDVGNDRDQHNALAAKGYAECFKAVRAAIGDILDGSDSADVVKAKHLQWFNEMFQPSVAAGLLSPDRLVGYRTQFVFLRGSRFVPVAHESIPDAMEAYFHCLKNEDDPRVRAILGHFVFTYIHPIPDGNGRIGRFIMNTMLASAGLPWTVVPIDERSRYMQALDTASLDGDIKSFAALIADLVKREPPPPRKRVKDEEPTYRNDEAPVSQP